MEAGSIETHANKTAEAFLEDLKRHNEFMLADHKRQLEAQYQEQLSMLLAQFRPAGPPIQTTKISLNSAAADERNAKVAQRASDAGSTPQISIYEGRAKTQVLRMASEKRGPESIVVDAHSAHFEKPSPRSTAPSSSSATAPPIHPSLRNSIYGKGSLLLKADKGAKKKGPSAGPAVRAHNFNETVVRDPTPEEAEDMALKGKLDGQTNFMLKKTAFLIDDSSRTLSEVAAREGKKNKKKARVQRARGAEGAGAGVGHGGREASNDWEDNNDADAQADMYATEWGQRRGRQAGGAQNRSDAPAGFSSFFRGDSGGAEGGEVDDEGYIEEEDMRQSLSRARDGISREGPIEDNVRGVRSAQGGRDGSPALAGAPQGGTRLLPVYCPNSSGSGGVGGGILRVVEYNDALRAEAQGSEDEQQTGPDWDMNRRVNNYQYVIDPHVACSKSEWENEIARHVLSVYATAKIADKPQSPQHKHEAAYVIDFVDIDKEETRATVRDYVMSEDGLGPQGRPGPGPDSGDDYEGAEWVDYVAEEEGAAGGGPGCAYTPSSTGPKTGPFLAAPRPLPKAPHGDLDEAVEMLSITGTATVASSVDEDEAMDAFDANKVQSNAYTRILCMPIHTHTCL